MPRISVVIPTYNEATYVGRLLKALDRQTFRDFEVIVSDANSKDAIKNVIAEAAGNIDVKLVQNPPQGPAAGRNQGAAKAAGEWLLFLDADVDIDDSNFLKTLLSQAEARGWSTTSTAYKVKDASLAERLGAGLNYRYIRMLAHTKHPVAPGFCIFTKRELFAKNHGFDEKLFFGEDYDYVTRVGKHGFGFVTTTYYYQDLRRFRNGSGAKMFINNVMAEIYWQTHGHKVHKPPFKYEFGKHQKRGD